MGTLFFSAYGIPVLVAPALSSAATDSRAIAERSLIP